MIQQGALTTAMAETLRSRYKVVASSSQDQRLSPLPKLIPIFIQPIQYTHTRTPFERPDNHEEPHNYAHGPAVIRPLIRGGRLEYEHGL